MKNSKTLIINLKINTSLKKEFEKILLKSGSKLLFNQEKTYYHQRQKYLKKWVLKEK